MQIKSFGSMVLGFTLCAGLLGGMAAAKGKVEAGAKQIKIKLEWVNVNSSGAKSSESLLIVTDNGQRGSSSDLSDASGQMSRQTAEVAPTLNSDGTVTIQVVCNLDRGMGLGTSGGCTTTVTVPNNETRVIKGFTRKASNGSSSETLLFITPNY